ncbi:thioredoxin reductase [Diplogelasinospora grovesii]|uniref:thioredoxin-disulfide reductase (NADPH) n=1 Tax=Diplogelasinospora grovesii TaxID=303347 RepID=A0AAN6N058_9PEZI|nr:thioredoxin reductase [Diplogelasinospora grovesii]
MRGIQLTQYVKGPHELKVTDLPDPTPKPDEYLIEVHAAATNFFDILQIQGKYQHQPPFPWVSGAEFAGVVLATPSNASKPKFPVGSRVFGASQGAYATQVTAKEHQLLPCPEGWSFEEAAGLFVTAPTSYGALVVRAGIKPGDYVLVHAAAGGVGLAAVQVAKAFGATVIATAGTKRKLEVARNFGADHVIDYRDEKWPEMVKKLTPGNKGVDIVYDPVGLVDKSTKCTAWNGRILIVGFAAGSIEKVAMNKVLLKNISLVGIHWGQYAVHEKETVVEVWKGIMKLVAEKKFRGTEFTDRQFVGLESIPDALKALGGRETWGKVVVKVPQGNQSLRRLSNSTSGQSPIKPTSTPSALTPAPLPDDPGTTAKLFSSYFRRTLRSSATGLSAAAAATATYKNTPRNAELQSVTRRMHSKVVIIGSGPAAHTAAIYLARAELKPVLYEGFMANGIAAGGQLTTTTEVENFPGFPEGIMGQELMDKMKQQSERFGTEVITETVSKVDLSSRPFKYATEWYPDVEHTADSIILATGASARRLGLPGEEKYWQNGISACAVCDGAVPIYRNKHLIVIGGGDSAAEEAMFLTKYGSHVTVLVRRDKLRASTIMAKRLLSHNKITVRFNTVGVEVKGDAKGLMSHMVVKDVVTGQEETLEANGLFYAIGHDPATGLVKGQIDTDEDGYVKTIPGTTQTNVPGVFAAGDVQDKRYRQAITSAGSGCMAALEAEKYLSEMHEVTEEHEPAKNGHL